MRILKCIFALGLMAVMAPPPAASETTQISWQELKPALPDLESPFASLSPEQLADMRTHIEWRTSPLAKKQDEAFEARAERAVARLTEAGVKVEALMDQRRKLILQRQNSAAEPNSSMLGKRVRLPGYALPIALEERRVTEFLLVPAFGMCVHTPLPSPNQAVHVSFPDGIELNRAFQAVWIEGVMQAEPLNKVIRFTDGIAPVRSNYALTADMVVEYAGKCESTANPNRQTGSWRAHTMERSCF